MLNLNTISLPTYLLKLFFLLIVTWLQPLHFFQQFPEIACQEIEGIKRLCLYHSMDENCSSIDARRHGKFR